MKTNNNFLLIVITLITIIMIFYIFAAVSIFKINAARGVMDGLMPMIEKLEDDSNKRYYIEYLYKCPSYVSSHYNCEKFLRFENITGKYCDNILVCENKYVLNNYTSWRSSNGN